MKVFLYLGILVLALFGIGEQESKPSYVKPPLVAVDVRPVPNTGPITTPQHGPVNTAPSVPTPPVTYTQAQIDTLIGANAAAASGVDAENPRTVTLPQGIYKGYPRIPNGTHDLIIQGAGIGKTVFEPDSKKDDLFRIGFYNYFASTTIQIEDVDEGDATVTLSDGESAPTVGHYYVLEDPDLVIENTGSSTGACSSNGSTTTFKSTVNLSVGATVFFSSGTAQNVGLARTISGKSGPVADEYTYTISALPSATASADEFLYNYTSARNHRELVKVSAVDGSTITLTFASQPAGFDTTAMPELEHTGAARDYTNPQLVAVNTNTCRNIQIKDVEIKPKGGQNVFNCGVIDGLSFLRCKVDVFQTNAYRVIASINVTFEDCIASSASASGAGGGYGFALYSVRGALIDSCTGLKGSTGQMRHSFILHSGTTDVLLKDCLSDGGSYDLHGFDERRVMFDNCDRYSSTSTVGADTGNNAWNAGAKHVLFKNCDMYGPIGFHGNVTNAKVLNGHFSKLRLEYTNDADGSPVEGKVESLVMNGAYFEHTDTVFTWYAASGGVVKVGTVSAVNCTFKSTSTANFPRIFEASTSQATGGDDLRSAQVEGTFSFDTCTFIRTGHASPLTPIRLQPGNRALNFTMDTCTITSPTQFGVLLADLYGSGTCTLTDNILTTAVGSPAFLSDTTTVASGFTLDASGNTAGP